MTHQEVQNPGGERLKARKAHPQILQQADQNLHPKQHTSYFDLHKHPADILKLLHRSALKRIKVYRRSTFIRECFKTPTDFDHFFKRIEINKASRSKEGHEKETGALTSSARRSPQTSEHGEWQPGHSAAL